MGMVHSMHQEKYNLKWHTYSEHLREMLYEMMMSYELTDVTLVCDDRKQFKAHKIVLSACSTVFKSIINDLPKESSVIFLRGIQHQEMQSIMEFMYSGGTSFDQERMDEFFNVARNLEIKELSKEVINSSVEFDFEDPLKADHENYNELERKLISNMSLEITEEADNDKRNENDNEIASKFISKKNEDEIKIETTSSDSYLLENAKGMFDCNQCESKYSNKNSLRYHIKSQHEGIRYNCNQCEYQATNQSHLAAHIQSQHEGVKYACNHCDKQFTQNSKLTRHIKSIHEGVQFNCNLCTFVATRQDYLKSHYKKIHE